MSGNVNNSPEALRQYAQQIRSFIDSQEQLLGQLLSAHSGVGSVWRDAQYEKFGDNLDMLIKHISNAVPAFDQYARHLDGKANILDEYLK
ncbi:WXG100 family type VII secretion target [Fictibacillus barbaricus]|uniref:WXG100 family type VII secretion target n=1 Tax=Fictibacillus barbaricus TaxID=182136 RepID=A0ABS2ZFQ5_9BACL|nr:WXG100 family type VII secretion target [Fictibacillus barbaricus]MBN3545441.1 hypothetical protein [Fictibacillus barbaricus]GGB53423.1 hypothetical protein GCM10007199_18860 [Fictibacillus barbaricus]